jgi:hypothetical protein
MTRFSCVQLQVPQPSEDDKAQFRRDLPYALRNAPRLGAVSQFPHSPDRFAMVRPEVEVRAGGSAELTCRHLGHHRLL